MIENFVCRVETGEDTRKKAVAALGFDERPVEEKLSRGDFDSDEAYFRAVAELSVRNNSPEYREAYRRIRKQYNAEKQAEAEAKAAEEHEARLKKAIAACTLSEGEQGAVDSEASRLAQADITSGKISYEGFGSAVEEYKKKLGENAKRKKVHAADFNRQLREAIATACGR